MVFVPYLLPIYEKDRFRITHKQVGMYAYIKNKKYDEY